MAIMVRTAILSTAVILAAIILAVMMPEQEANKKVPARAVLDYDEMELLVQGIEKQLDLINFETDTPEQVREKIELIKRRIKIAYMEPAK